MNGYVLMPSWTYSTCCLPPLLVNGRFVRMCKRVSSNSACRMAKWTSAWPELMCPGASTACFFRGERPGSRCCTLTTLFVQAVAMLSAPAAGQWAQCKQVISRVVLGHKLGNGRMPSSPTMQDNVCLQAATP